MNSIILTYCHGEIGEQNATIEHTIIRKITNLEIILTTGVNLFNNDDLYRTKIILSQESGEPLSQRGFR